MSQYNFTQKEILTFIKEQPIRISVFGEFSSGKTTFINGLIGEAILSVAVDPTTAVPTYIRFAKEFNILVHLNNDEHLLLFKDEPPFWTRFVGRQSVLNTLKKQEGEIREFLKEWTKEGERADEVKNIIIEMPLPWLKNNIELVDTPGTNAGIDSHKQHTKQVSEDTDLAIFLMDARQGGGKKTEFNFMNEVQQTVSQSFVVVNKMDLLDEEDDEREDILDFIINEAIPNHWKGIIQPEVFGISSLARLDKKLAGKEPELLKEFERLITVVENIATTHRGKILLNRLENPEKTLFEQATNFESEKRFDKAHRVYFDLLDILKMAEMDITPAQNGIKRCEDILNSQVSELDKINSDVNSAIAFEEKEPDESIKKLRKIQKRLTEINAPDGEVDKTIIRLEKRIKIRDKARQNIEQCEKSAKISEKIKKYISAVELMQKYHSFTEKAELNKKELQRLENYENELKQKRDIELQSQLDLSLKFEEKEPDESIKKLRKIQKRLTEINAPDGEVDKTIIRLEKRIKIRDKARQNIEQCEKSAKISEKIKKYISAVELMQKYHSFTEKAELNKKELQRLENYENELKQKRDIDSLKQWEILLEQINAYFDKNDYWGALGLIPNIDTYRPYLNSDVQKKSQDLINIINSKNECWNAYKNLFGELKDTFSKAFKEHAVDSSIVLNSLNDFTKAENFAKKFTKGYKKQLIISVNKNYILTVDERIQVIEFIINVGSVFKQTKLTKLKKQLLIHKKNIANIPEDVKVWFDNPEYFEKFPDHPAFIKNITSDEFEITFLTSPWKIIKIKKQIKKSKIHLNKHAISLINPILDKYNKLIKRQEIVFIAIVTLVIIFVKGLVSWSDNESVTKGNQLDEAWKYYDRKEVGQKVDTKKNAGCILGNCQNGFGTYIWANGDKYDGEWKNDKRNGYGTFTWANGYKYVGEWKNDKINGFGTYIWADGTKECGEYQNGFGDKRIVNCNEVYTFLSNRYPSFIQVENSETSVNDIDGNIYKTIKIGSQIWMAENLKVAHYRNGDKIQTGHSDTDWVNLSTGAYAVYDNNENNADTYGYLYNWYAVDDSRNIAPKGWHIPTDEEWNELEIHLGMSQSIIGEFGWRDGNIGSQLAGNLSLWSYGILKSKSTFDESGFTALPSGYRSHHDGDYTEIGTSACFWSSSTQNDDHPLFRLMKNNISDVYRGTQLKNVGFTVRCVRD